MLLICFLGLFAGIRGASAQVLFDNGPAYAFQFGAFADTGYTYYMAGNVFSPTLSGTANQITFGGYYANQPATTPADSFTFSLYSANSNGPESLIGTGTLSDVDRSVISGTNGASLYSYTASITTPFSLTAGESYYLGLSDTTTPYELFSFAATYAQPSALSEYSYGNGAFVENPNFALSFELSDVASVPEPSSWTLGLLSILFCGTLLFYRDQSARCCESP